MSRLGLRRRVCYTPKTMVQPIVLPRAEHTLSRRDIDPDALKVMSRLQELGFTAYLVGGSVRDLLLARRPKDFDIGTSALPHHIKRAFRNCWIIGRRFRLAHVKFGTKTIEVATFRRNLRADAVADTAAPDPPETPLAADGGPPPPATGSSSATTRTGRPRRTRSVATSRSTRCSTTPPSAPLSTTSAACRIFERRVIRSIGDPLRAVPGRSRPNAACARARRASRLWPR